MNTFATLKAKRWFRILFTILKIFLVLYIVWKLLMLFLTWPNYWDDKTIDDADLIPIMKEAVTPAINAATYLPIKNDATDFEKSILAKKPVFKDNQFYIEDKVVSGEMLQNFILDSQPLVTKFENAAAQSIYQCPMSFNKYEVGTEFCQLNTLRDLAELVVFHVEYSLQNSDASNAIALTTSLLKVGHLVVEQVHPASIVEHLVGFAIMKLALNTIEANPELKEVFRSQILKFIITDDSSARALQAEYLTIKNSTLTAFSGETETEKNILDQGTYFLRPKETVNNVAEYFRLSVDAASTPCNVAPDDAKLDSLVVKYKNSLSIIGFFQPNFLGRVLISTILSSNAVFRDTRCEINTRINTIAS